MSPAIVIGLLTATATLAVAWLIYENITHQRAVASIPMRIHVNGSRGKSSVTRLIAGGLREGGFTTLAKTTGSSPRIVDIQGKDRLIHRLRSASIGEQVKLIRGFARLKPDAMVIECMAVQPQYQWVSEHRMIHATIGVITNVRRDHVDEMGQTTDQIARSLANTIPRNGMLVTAEDNQLAALREVAAGRGSRLYTTHNQRVSQSILEKFPYLEHPENVSLALRVCRLAGVSPEIALQGMINAQPDVGALVKMPISFPHPEGKSSGKKFLLLNALAANDPDSTLRIWKLITEQGWSNRDTVIFLNTRDDRRLRTRQLLDLVVQKIEPAKLIIRGETTQLRSMMKNRQINYPVVIVDQSRTPDRVVEQISTEVDRKVLFAIGNMVGPGWEIIREFKKYRVR